MRRLVYPPLGTATRGPAPPPLDALDPAIEADDARTRLKASLKAGVEARDGWFDRFLPLSMRIASGQFWTPLVVIQRAAAWIDEHEIRTVVDIGSGAGKFCVAGALACGAVFTGVEQRGRLVAAASRLAGEFGVADRVAFVDAVFGETTTPVAEAYYLFNPFGENLFSEADHLDSDVELNRGRYLAGIAAVEALLRDAAVGTFVFTYNGFGGGIPASFQEIRVARDLPNVLRLWRKTRAASGGVSYSADAR